MAVPLVVIVSFWLLFLPPLAALVRRRDLDAARRALIGWFLLMIVGNIVAVAWVRFVDRTNNLIVSQVVTPIEGVAILWAVAEFQILPLARSTVRFAIPLVLLAQVAGYFLVEDLRNFSIVGAPILALVVLAAALFALVTRLHADSEPALASGWLWILSGIAIYFATNAAVSILQAIYTQQQDWPSLVRVSTLKAWIDIPATLLITGGLLWPTRPPARSTSSS